MRIVAETLFHHIEALRPGHPAQLTTIMYNGIHPADSSEGPFGHANAWILDYSLEDGMAIRTGGPDEPWYARRAGEAHLYPPGFRFWERLDPGRGAVRSAFAIFVGGERLGLAAYVDNPAGFCRFRDGAGRIRRLLEAWARDALAPPGRDGFWRCQAQLFRMVDLLLDFAPTDAAWERIDTAGRPGRDDAERGFVHRVRAALHARYGRSFGFDEVARELGVSRSTLAHKYRAAAGESLRQTLATLRLNAVKVLLLKREKLRSIAEQTGFRDEFHLSKFFKRQTGVSPRHFCRASFAAAGDPAAATRRA